MKEEGFTLIELMGILVLLGVIAMITVPVVTNSLESSKETAYETQLNQIKKAAKDWSANNASSLPVSENSSITITLGALKQGGYIDVDIKDPVTNKLFYNCMFIEIKKHNNKYVYTVLDKKLPEGCSEDTDVFEASIILKGSNEMELNIGDSFVDPKVEAKASSGSVIEDVDIVIKKGEQTVSSIDTSKVGTYTITYSVVSNGTVSSVTRNVIVKDKTSPVITVNGNTSRFTIEVAKNSTFTIPSATALDNIDGDLTSKITVSGTVNTNVIGTYELEYSVTDNSGNVRNLKVVVKVK